MSHFRANVVSDVIRFSLGEGVISKRSLHASLAHRLACFWIHVAHSLFDSILTMTPRLSFISPISYVRKLIQTRTAEA